MMSYSETIIPSEAWGCSLWSSTVAIMNVNSRNILVAVAQEKSNVVPLPLAVGCVELISVLTQCVFPTYFRPSYYVSTPFNVINGLSPNRRSLSSTLFCPDNIWEKCWYWCLPSWSSSPPTTTTSSSIPSCVRLSSVSFGSLSHSTQPFYFFIGCSAWNHPTLAPSSSLQ